MLRRDPLLRSLTALLVACSAGAPMPASDSGDEDPLNECETLCDALECGLDPCGFDCGTCASGQTCTDEGQCAPVPQVCGDGLVTGDETCDPGPAGGVVGCTSDCQVLHGYTCDGEPSECTHRDLEEDGTLCSRPIVIEGGKLYARLSVAGQFNSYTPFFGECLDSGYGTASYGPDLTFSVRLGEGETARARMRSNVMPVTVAFSTACGADDPEDYVLNESCVAIDQQVAGVWAEVEWTAPQSTTLYIITGTPSSTSAGPFDFQLVVLP